MPEEAVVTIGWARDVVPFAELETADSELLDGRGFYAILSGKPDLATLLDDGDVWRWSVTAPAGLLYIGVAYHQNLRERIPQEHTAYRKLTGEVRFNPRRNDPIVLLGDLQDGPRPSEKLYLDIECALVFSNQPRANVPCKKTYQGRRLDLINRGSRWPLTAGVRLAGGEVW